MPEGFNPRPEPISADRTGRTPEGGSLLSRLRPKRVEAQCFMGNGECPRTCELYPAAVEATVEFGRERTPMIAIDILAGVSLEDASIIIAQCQKEQKA